MRDTCAIARFHGGFGAGGSFWHCRKLALVNELQRHDAQTSRRAFSMSLGGFTASEISEFVRGREDARMEIQADLDELDAMRADNAA